MIKTQTEIRSVFITAGWKYNRLVIEYRLQGDKKHSNKRNNEKENEKDKEDE